MSEPHDNPLLEDEGAGYLISMSDLMAGLLFIFLITLMVFVLSFQRATESRDTEKDHLERETTQAIVERDRLRRVVEDLTNSRALRSAMLARIRVELESQGIHVEVDTEHGILHLTEEAINFPSSRAELAPEEAAKLGKIGAVLMRVLPCYAESPPAQLECDPGKEGKLESVFIEGHTDNMPYARGRFHDNWDLSAQRAMYTYRVMVDREQPGLAHLKNGDGLPIFSVTGYGEGRPRNAHAQPTPDAANRRIDMRFIMTPPEADVGPVTDLRDRGL
jgi:chemotaxis protein MotB